MPYRELAEIPPEPPLSEPGFVRERRRLRRRAWLAFAVSLPVLGGVVLGGARWQEYRTEQRRISAARAARTCLLGAPLGPGESASLRFRERQLEAVNRVEQRGFATWEERWPGRCAKGVRAAADAQRDPDVQTYSLLAGWLMDREAALGDRSSLVDTAVYALDQDAPPSVGQVLPRPLDVDGLDAASRIEGDAPAAFAANPDAIVRAVFGVLACRFAAGQPGRCETLSEWFYGTRVDSTTSADVLRSAVQEAPGPEDETQVTPVSSTTRRDGSTVSLGVSGTSQAGRAYWLAPSGRTPVRFAPSQLLTAQLLWDELYVRRHDPRENLELLEVTSLDDALGGHPALRRVLGPTELNGSTVITGIRGCRTAVAQVVASQSRLAFRHADGSFSKSLEIPFGTLACHGAVATITNSFVAPTASLQHTSCTEDACQTAEFPTRSLDPNGVATVSDLHGNLQAVPLGDRLLVIWRGVDATGLRLRVGRPDELAGAPERVIFDDWVKGGEVARASTLAAFQLAAGDGFAALFLRTERGTYALRVDADGTVSPWPIQR